jgi:anti-sigma-K factor RskA
MWLVPRCAPVVLSRMRAMPNIVLDDGLRARVEELWGRRRDVWRVVVAIGIVVVIALFL